VPGTGHDDVCDPLYGLGWVPIPAEARFGSEMAASLPKIDDIVYKLGEVDGFNAEKVPLNQGCSNTIWERIQATCQSEEGAISTRQPEALLTEDSGS
jgi:hypothetical protein